MTGGLTLHIGDGRDARAAFALVFTEDRTVELFAALDVTDEDRGMILAAALSEAFRAGVRYAAVEIVAQEIAAGYDTHLVLHDDDA